jgi:hypothetical protein
MRKIDLLLADSFDGLISKLEAFGHKFEQLATTADQRKLAARFNAFVGEIIQELSPPGEEKDGHQPPATQMEYFLRLHGHESLSDLFAEIRVDEAAAKREDAHWYGKEAFKKILGGKTETPAAEMAQDKGIER